MRCRGRWQRIGMDTPPIPPPAATRVLVVDDDAVIRSLIAVTLSLEGFEISEASDGRQALAKLRLLLPKVVTLDATMPDLSGPEVALRLRADPSTAAIKILLLSGRRPGHEPRRREFQYVDAWLDKPFDPGELVAIVRRLAV
jgi:CheY-like chemotaxis protein